MALIAAFGILAVAAAVQAASGLRFALIAVPPLAVAADARTAVVGGIVGPRRVVGVNGRPMVDVLGGLALLRPREPSATLAAVFSAGFAAAGVLGVPYQPGGAGCQLRTGVVPVVVQVFAATGRIIRHSFGMDRLAAPAVTLARWAGNVLVARSDSAKFRFRRIVRGALVVSSGATAMRAVRG